MSGLNGCGHDKCPKCGSGLNTYRHPGAKVWCTVCGLVLQEEGMDAKAEIARLKAEAEDREQSAYTRGCEDQKALDELTIIALKAERDNWKARAEKAEAALEEVAPIGDIAEGLAPYYIHSDTIKRIRKVLSSQAPEAKGDSHSKSESGEDIDWEAVGIEFDEFARKTFINRPGEHYELKAAQAGGSMMMHMIRIARKAPEEQKI